MKNKFMNVMTSIGEKGKENAPALLAGIALIGVVTTGILAFKAGLKANDILKNQKEELDMVDPEDKEAIKQVKKETIKKIVPVVSAPILMGVTTSACVLGGHHVSQKRLAVLSAAYSVAEKSVTDLNQKMVDILGEGKAKTIKDAVTKDKFKSMEKDGNIGEKIVVTGNGDVPCIDLYTGQPFYSNADKIRRAINELSSECGSNMYVELNDLYEKLRIPIRPVGRDFGWNSDDLIRGQLPITVTAVLSEDERPMLAIDYDIKPRYDFRYLH